jgi:LysM repeat protein
MREKGKMIGIIVLLVVLVTTFAQADWLGEESLPAVTVLPEEPQISSMDIYVGELALLTKTMGTAKRTATENTDADHLSDSEAAEQDEQEAETIQANEPIREAKVTASRSGNRSNAAPAPAPASVPTPEPAQEPIQPLKEVSEPVSQPQQASTNYVTHTIKQGDTFWNVANRYGIPMQELLEANNLSENSPINLGMTLAVPQYSIPAKETPGPQYGELVDWWTEAQYLWPMGQNARIVDFTTGRSFMARRTFGAFHADVEPLTAKDAQIMREIWGGWSWNTRPVIVEINGRRLAASSHAMPHSIQKITNNNFNGHFCVHFLNSTRHKDNLPQRDHQDNILRAAGKK